ncbi:hypothetical protein L6452_14294 [Arctium lappa]|uniref:Uncharacterized protein n=1 Tax=Arctium lappa TaxID=4217 RepID=A0ACB9CKK7_ARCLA|nr:hypothetical protein L6452_14294 [Arctium lappa]
MDAGEDQLKRKICSSAKCRFSSIIKEKGGLMGSLLLVMMGVWGLCHVRAMPWLYLPAEPLVIFLIIFAKVPVGGLDSSNTSVSSEVKSSAAWR